MAGPTRMSAALSSPEAAHADFSLSNLRGSDKTSITAEVPRISIAGTGFFQSVLRRNAAVCWLLRSEQRQCRAQLDDAAERSLQLAQDVADGRRIQVKPVPASRGARRTLSSLRPSRLAGLSTQRRNGAKRSHSRIRPVPLNDRRSGSHPASAAASNITWRTRFAAVRRG